jgi:hypothetical protein
MNRHASPASTPNDLPEVRSGGGSYKNAVPAGFEARRGGKIAEFWSNLEDGDVAGLCEGLRPALKPRTPERKLWI